MIANSIAYFNASSSPNQFLVFQKNINPFINSAVANISNLVLDTDYVNYALIYLCTVEPNIRTGQMQVSQYIWMLTRSAEMSNTTLNIMANDVANLVDSRTNQNLGIKLNDFTAVPQVGCIP